MTKYMGIMTGNSMDAIDIVVSDWYETGVFSPAIKTYTVPFSNDMRQKMQELRLAVQNKTKEEIEKLEMFKPLHDAYLGQVAEAVKETLNIYGISAKEVAAIGFHGKTLDHLPPSVAKRKGLKPYTLQIGSGQMLADLTGIPVFYDPRSADLMAGGDAAPLAPPLSAILARMEGELDRIDFNAGNTSNLAVIIDGEAVQGWDAGPCNEFPDAFVRKYTHNKWACDKDGQFGLKGNLKIDLLQKVWNAGKDFYELPPPKSGDPAYYSADRIFEEIEKTDGVPQVGTQTFNDIVHTLEYFSGYVAVHTLSYLDKTHRMPQTISMFGGGWHNPVIKQTFEKLISGDGFVLPEHKELFDKIVQRTKGKVLIRFSSQEKYMESLIWTAMAFYYDHKKPWTSPHLTGCSKTVISGEKALPALIKENYTDSINKAAKGWQERLKR